MNKIDVQNGWLFDSLPIISFIHICVTIDVCHVKTMLLEQDKLIFLKPFTNQLLLKLIVA